MNPFLEPILGKTLLDTFDTHFAAWSKDGTSEVVWLRNWAGKEVLKLVRQDLARQFRPPIASANHKIEPVVWGSGTGKSYEIKEQDDQLDRDIERAIQPVLIKHLFLFAESNPQSDLTTDLGRIKECFRY